MAKCEICGTDTESKAMMGSGEESLMFDNPEAFIQAVTHVCAYCGSKILEGGARSDGAIYCFDDMSDIEF